MEGNVNNNNIFFYELSRNAKNELIANNTRMSSIANTYQNEPQYQTAENLSRNYVRKGQEIYDDPFKYVQRPLSWDYQGRNLNILNSLIMNRNRDYPDFISTPLKVVGYY